MTQQYLLLAEDDGLSAYKREGDQLEQVGHFANDENGRADFSAHLSQNARDSHCFLANISDEQHIRENIPLLRGADRRALIARRMAHHFSADMPNTSISLGREAGSPPREQLVIAALTDTTKLAPWQQTLETFATPCDGIYSLSQIGPALLRRLDCDVSNCLLLMQCGTSIRESYLRNGQLIFSRQRTLIHESQREIAECFREEALKLEQYLLSQREITRDQALKVYMLLHPDAIACCGNSSPTNSALEYRLIDLPLAAKRFKRLGTPNDSDAKILCLQFFLGSKPARRFEPFAPRRLVIAAQLRRALWAVGLGMAIVSIGPVLYWQLEVRQVAIAELEQRATTASLVREHPGSTSSESNPENSLLRSLAEQYPRIARQQIGPESAFLQLGEALDQQPEINVDEIQWLNHLADTPPQNIEATLLAGKVELDEAPAQRAIIAAQERLVTNLKQAVGTTVTIEQSAVMLESSQAMRQDSQSAPAGRFTLRINRSIAP